MRFYGTNWEAPIATKPSSYTLPKRPKTQVTKALSPFCVLDSLIFPPYLIVTLEVLVVTMALTDFHIRNANLQTKQYKLSAELGLYLIIVAVY